MELIVPISGFPAAMFVWKLAMAVTASGIITPWKLIIAVIVAALITVSKMVLRRDRMNRAAWKWAGFALDSARTPSPQDILDGCRNRKRSLVSKGSFLAGRMRDCGLHEGSKIFDLTETALSLFFESVLHGEDIEAGMQAAKKNASIALHAGYLKGCNPKLREDLRAWCRDVGDWIEVVSIVGKEAAVSLKTQQKE